MHSLELTLLIRVSCEKCGKEFNDQMDFTKHIIWESDDYIGLKEPVCIGKFDSFHDEQDDDWNDLTLCDDCYQGWGKK